MPRFIGMLASYVLFLLGNCASGFDAASVAQGRFGVLLGAPTAIINASERYGGTDAASVWTSRCGACVAARFLRCRLLFARPRIGRPDLSRLRTGPLSHWNACGPTYC